MVPGVRSLNNSGIQHIKNPNDHDMRLITTFFHGVNAQAPIDLMEYLVYPHAEIDKVSILTPI